eukprot:SAG31_NODE_19696_length_594_cov_0.935354_1_plen_105_part_10
MRTGACFPSDSDGAIGVGKTAFSEFCCSPTFLTRTRPHCAARSVTVMEAGQGNSCDALKHPTLASWLSSFETPPAADGGAVEAEALSAGDEDTVPGTRGVFGSCE